jgi:hypothetical protein
MNYKVVESREIVWCDSDDRYILIIKENDAIVGLNFMQGDELDIFKRDFSNIDYDLTNFFNAVEPYLDGGDQVDRINGAIWAFHEYSVLRDEREYNNNNK